MPGFAEDQNGKSVMVGFARNAVMGVAGAVIEAVKNKNIRHFFLVAGCDGAKPGSNYYTEFVEKVPKDCVVLTLACGKFRFFDKDLGDIGGIPRLLDMGQCNDAYSAVAIAKALAGAFNVGVNDLPLSMVLSWYEQKAVAILLSLLSPRHQEYQARAVPSGVRHARRARRAGEELQRHAGLDTGRGFESDPGLILSTFRGRYPSIIEGRPEALPALKRLQALMIPANR